MKETAERTESLEAHMADWDLTSHSTLRLLAGVTVICGTLWGILASFMLG